MEVMLFLDIHHEGLSIGTLGNFHVPIMQFIHSRWYNKWRDRLPPVLLAGERFSRIFGQLLGSSSSSTPFVVLDVPS